VLSKRRKNDGVAVYVPKENILKKMAVKIKLSQRSFLCPLCGLVVRVLGYRFGGPGSIPGTTRKKK
jgi:hypothetical protein